MFLVGWLVTIAIAPARAEKTLAEKRQPIDQQFAEALETLASKCESLQLEEQARQTRAWRLDRDPNRQYLFLPGGADTRPSASAPNVIQYWYQHFVAARDKHAANLFELARQHWADEPSRAFQLLHEVLHESPDHEEARRILGYRKHLGRWRRGSRGVSSRVARVAHPLFGWPPRRYWRVETPHFEITTSHGVKGAESLGEQLELLYDVWRQAFYRYWADDRELGAALAGERIPLRSDKKHRIVLFRDREEYVAKMRPYIPNIELSEGIYVDTRQTSYFYAGDQAAISVWYHEAAHQLFQELGPGLPDVGQRDNFWIVEGVALYMESLVRHQGYATLGGFDAPRLQYARYRAFNHHFYVPLAELTVMGRDDVQRDDRIRPLYSQFAGLAHFLMDYNAGSFRAACVDYLIAVYAGRARRDALEQLAGVPLADLDDQYLRFLDVTDEQVARYLRPTNLLTKLSLGHTSITDATLDRLTAAEHLDWLDLADTKVTDQGIRLLGRLSKLTQLNLEGTKVTDQSLQVIGAMKQLQQLDLSRTGVSDAGLSSLAELTKLEELWLTETRISDEGLAHLTKLARLATLDTNGTPVSAAGRRQLQKRLPALED